MDAEIMVVEDEGLVALEIQDALESMGYRVPCVVASGEEALQKVLMSQPDLILMDIRLDGKLDGIQTAKEIRQSFSIPVIFLTAHSDENTIKEATFAESYGYILKPFEERALQAAIEVALYKAKKEKSLKNSKDWYSTILASLDEGLLVADIKGSCKFCNEKGASILGIQASEVVTKRLHDLFRVFKLNNKDEQLQLPISAPIMDDTIVKEDSQLLLSQDNQYIEISYSIAPLKNENQTTIGLLIMFRDKEKPSRVEKEIKRELEKPKEYQIGLLPARGKKIANVKIDWIFHPSTFGSGDLFNFFSLDESHVGFFLLDVMGHGFSASVLSITLHNFLSPDIEKVGILKRAQDKNHHHPMRREGDNQPKIVSPKNVIQELNRRFYFETNNNPFFTLVYGIVNTDSGVCTIARAGHLHPIHQSQQGHLTPIESDGQAVGILPEIRISEQDIKLNKGDRLFLFSDGLIESTDDKNNQFSLSRLEDFIRDNQGLGMSELTDKLDQTLMDWNAKDDFDDDVAFMVFEYQ
ncbi:MAG: SpoIIE family protein phosphatase [Spirochaetales bacterium]|nr:SpoIIE family protein phosphatase [Spirochaetales bacterium]